MDLKRRCRIIRNELLINTNAYCHTGAVGGCKSICSYTEGNPFFMFDKHCLVESIVEKFIAISSRYKLLCNKLGSYLLACYVRS